MTSRLVHVSWSHPDAVALRDAMTSEVSAKYAEDRAAANRDGSMVIDPDSIVMTGLLYEGEKPIAHVALRRLGEDYEIKRMYIPPSHRGRGLAGFLLHEAEEAAREDGAHRVILHTGTRQEPAIALYRRHGYTEIPIYPPYVGLPHSLCFEKVLESDS